MSRSPENLARDFEGTPAERHPADLEDPAAALEAVRGRDLALHAVGLPAERFERHVPIARNVAAACRESGARPFLVTSYWSYGPGDEDPMPETRPRAEGSAKAAIREREEEVFFEAEGAVARLPDFFGPEPGLSLLNDALDAVRRGETVSWPGNPDAPRDFLYYGDAGRLLARLALHDEAYGEAWNVPGSGAATPRALLERAGELADGRVKIRRIRPWMARVAALVKRDVRALVDVMPLYEAPAVLDTSKLERLLGAVETTPYDEAVPATLEWLATR